MPTSLTIRDALPTDVEACLALDHIYSTTYVWQMNTFNDDGVWQIVFRPGRLPRAIDVQRPTYPARLQANLAVEHCYLVAEAIGDEGAAIAGYLTMRVDDVYGNAHIYDLVVDRSLRQNKIGTRLLRVARQWAQEHGAQRLLVEIRTKNYPAIQFFQKQGLSFCGFNDQYLPAQDIAVFFGQTLR